MPASPQTTLHQVNQAFGRLPQAVYVTLSALQIDAWMTPDPVPYAERRWEEG